MPYINFNSAKPGLKLLVTGLSIIAIGIITFFAGLLFSRLIFSMHLDDVNHIVYGRFDRLSDWQLKTYQIFQTLGFFVLPGFFLYWIFSSPEKEYFNVSAPRDYKIIIWTIVAFTASMPFFAWVADLNTNVRLPDCFSELETTFRTTEENYSAIAKRLTSSDNLGQLFFNLFMISILPAVGEEFIFRGVIQKIAGELLKNVHWAIIVTAILFSTFHGQFFGLLPRFLLGLFFGYLMVWSRNIWIPVIGHFVFNTISVIACYLYKHAIITIPPKELGIAGIFGFAVVISALIIGLSVYFIWKSSKRELTS